MSQTENKSQVVRLGEPHLTDVEMVREHWRKTRGGPDPTFAQTVRYLILMGREYEMSRLVTPGAIAETKASTEGVE